MLGCSGPCRVGAGECRGMVGSAGGAGEYYMGTHSLPRWEVLLPALASCCVRGQNLAARQGTVTTPQVHHTGARCTPQCWSQLGPGVLPSWCSPAAPHHAAPCHAAMQAVLRPLLAQAEPPHHRTWR